MRNTIVIGPRLVIKTANRNYGIFENVERQFFSQFTRILLECITF